MVGVLLQSAIGGSLPVVVAALFAHAVLLVLACWIVYRAFSGYRASGAPALLWLAVGIGLLSVAPGITNVLLPSLTSTPSIVTGGIMRAGEVLGLTAILYAIYDRSSPPLGDRRRSAGAAVVLGAAALAAMVTTPDPAFLMAAVSATLGLFVSSLAYLGYARNDSPPMLFLAVGIAFITAVSFVFSYGVDWATEATDAQVIVLVTLCRLVGLASIAHSLGGARR